MQPAAHYFVSIVLLLVCVACCDARRLSVTDVTPVTSVTLGATDSSSDSDSEGDTGVQLQQQLEQNRRMLLQLQQLVAWALKSKRLLEMEGSAGSKVERDETQQQPFARRVRAPKFNSAYW